MLNNKIINNNELLLNLKNKFLSKYSKIKQDVKSSINSILLNSISSEHKEKKEEVFFKNIYWYTNSKWKDYLIFENKNSWEIDYIFWVNDQNYIPNFLQKKAIILKWNTSRKNNFKKLIRNQRQENIVNYAIKNKQAINNYKKPEKKEIVKNPEMNWIFEYINKKWILFRFLCVKWKIAKIISNDENKVSYQQKSAIQRFINNKQISKFTKIEIWKKEKTISKNENRDNTIIKNIDNSIVINNNDIDQKEKEITNSLKIKREKELEFLYNILVKDIYEMLKYDFNKKFNNNQKKSALNIIKELSKKIPKSSSNIKRDNNLTAEILINTIQDFLKYWKYDTKKSQEYLTTLQSAFYSSKRIFLKIHNKNQQDNFFSWDVIFSY